MTATVRFDKWENTASTKSVTMDQIAGGSGLVPVVPQPSQVTVVTGTGSVNNIGLVSFSGATKVSLQNVFTADYENYLIDLHIKGSATTGLKYRFIIPDGSEQAYTAYSYQYLVGSGSSVFSGRVIGQSQGELCYIPSGTQPVASKAEVYKPFNSSFAPLITTRNSYDVGGASEVGSYNTNYGGAGVSYSGIALIPGTGNITGTIKIYGYR